MIARVFVHRMALSLTHFDRRVVVVLVAIEGSGAVANGGRGGK